MEQIYFHIGFHKTGTTWLQNKLFLNTKHFNLINDHTQPWSDELVKYIVTTHPNDFESDKLLEIIKPRMKNNKINIISAERLSGHPYSGGYDTILIAEKIYTTFPNAKIIIVTRDCNSFIISTFKQIVKQGYPGSFDKYINRNNWYFPITSKYYFEHKNTVSLYKKLFNHENILELDFNTFKINKSAFLGSISKFIDKKLTLNSNQQNHIVNKTYSNNRIRALKFLNKFRKTEYNQYPIIILKTKFINILSIIISPFFSNKNFILDET